MKLLIILFLSINTIFAGIYRSDIDVNELIELANQEKFDCVGEIKSYNQIFGGSCVAVSENIVITNGHLLTEVKTEPDTMEFNGQRVIVYQPVSERWVTPSEVSVELVGKTYSVKQIIIHPDYLDTNSREIDLAIIITNEKIEGVSFPKFYNAELQLGKEVIGVGYGASGVGNDPASVSSKGEKIYGTNTLDSIRTIKNEYKVFYTDFDSDDDSCNVIGSSNQTTYEFGSAGGDSGSPYFIMENDELFLIGILFSGKYHIDNIQKGYYYGSTSGVIEIKNFSSWIDEYK